MKHHSRSHRLRGALLVAGAAATGVLYAQALSLRPGNYEFVSSLQLEPETLAKLPPGVAKMMNAPQVQQQCISDSDLAKVGQKLSPDPKTQDSSCTMSDQKVSGSEASFVMHCAGTTVQFKGTFAAESFKATMVSTSDRGEKTTINLTGKRLGDCSK